MTEVEAVTPTLPVAQSELEKHVLCGRYEFFKDENLDGYLQGVGVGLIFRKTVSITRPRFEVSYLPETGEWLVRHLTVFFHYWVKFKIGEETRDETFDNRKCKTTVTWDETKKDVMVFNQVPHNGSESVKSTLEKLPDSTLKLVRRCGPHQCAEYYRLATDKNAGGDFIPGQAPATESTTSTVYTEQSEQSEETMENDAEVLEE